MKKIFAFAVAAFAAFSLTAQSNYKMRVVKTDGTEIFYNTSEVDFVDFKYVEDEPIQPEEPKEVTVFLAGDNVNQDGPCRVTRLENTGPDGGCILAYPENMGSP
ncbi:MAG: hypothetical protein U0L74_08525 [Paludibacteraceae bacterium]|nr:hypothetical protein [Paludibacteraceae bacterium]